MHALLLVAHGSRREASNQEVEALTQRIAARGDERFGLYTTAFLELASPSIQEALRGCITKGATKITIVPYFLAAGTHVVKDVPAIIEEMGDELGAVEVQIAPHVGQSPMMEALILGVAE
jgi:sirohydrochlorin ferrochelatase